MNIDIDTITTDIENKITTDIKNNLLFSTTLDLADMSNRKNLKNALSKTDPNRKYDSNGNTALMLAASCNFHELALLLIEAKANPDIHNKSGATALMIAAFSHSTNVVHELINAKANVNLVDHSGHSALDMMIANASLLTGLIRHGENSVSSAFADMIQSKNLLIISLLLNAGAIIQIPRHLFNFLMTCDQRDPDVLSSLECLYDQLCQQTPMIPSVFYEIQSYLEQLKKLTEIHQEKLINTVDKATGKKIVPDLVKIIAKYDAPLQDRIKFFKPEEIHSLFPKPEEHKETAPLEPVKTEKSKCSVM